MIFLKISVQCEDKNKSVKDAKDTTAKDKLTKPKSAKKEAKPVIVVASSASELEPVMSPQSWNSWTPVSQNSSKWLSTPNTTPFTVTAEHYVQPQPFPPPPQEPQYAQYQYPQYPQPHYQKPVKKQKKRGKMTGKCNTRSAKYEIINVIELAITNRSREICDD